MTRPVRDHVPLPEGIESLADVVALWPTAGAMADAIGLEDRALPRVWKRRQRIPNAWRDPVIKAAAALGVEISHDQWSVLRERGAYAGY